MPRSGDQHTTDLVLLDGLDEIAVPEGPRRSGWIGSVQESGPDHDHDHHKEDVQTNVAPAFVQGSDRLVKEC